MDDLSLLENSFKKFFNNIVNSPKESIINVDLALLHELDLLHYHSRGNTLNDSLTRYFQVIETPEKITLINQDFVVWIVPEKVNEKPITYIFIAFNRNNGPQLELTFITSGVYNTSRLLLKVLEKFLFDIQENEDTLNQIKTSLPT